jgi:hypothetical protein
MNSQLDERDADASHFGPRTLAGESARESRFTESLRFINKLVEAVGERITARDIEVAKRISRMQGARV